MFRLFKQYNAPAPYDGIISAEDASTQGLDPVEVAGTLKLHAIRADSIRRGLPFVSCLDIILSLSAFLAIIVSPISPIENLTSHKWRVHLEQLAAFNMLDSSVSKNEIHYYSRYFAVPKTDNTARAIINMRMLSKLLRAPDPVNLAEISQILDRVLGPYWITADWRHYFHQFGVAPGVQRYFGIQCAEKVWVYKTLPMGLSWSPRIAQATGWSIILEAAFRARLLDPKDFSHMHNPPAYVDRNGIFITLWYDNLLMTCQKAADRDLLLTKLKEVCACDTGYNCFFKHLACHNLDHIGPKSKSKPKYLGLEFCTIENKRERDGRPTRTLQWRHATDRIKRWEDLREVRKMYSPRLVARAVGIILWNATIGLIPFCEEEQAINLLRTAGHNARDFGKGGWDKLTDCWNTDDISHAIEKVKSLLDNNPWHSRTIFPIRDEVWAASDASGTIGYGGVRLSGSDQGVEILKGRWCDEGTRNLQDAHIYIQEFYAATRTIEILCKGTSQHGAYYIVP